MATLAREEYIEQAYLFQAMADRINSSDPVAGVVSKSPSGSAGHDPAADGDQIPVGRAATRRHNGDRDAKAWSLLPSIPGVSG